MTNTAGDPPPHGQVPLSRRRGGLAASRGGYTEAERTFFCRICQRVERGLWVPSGWYLLERAPGGRGRHLRLGLYCSLACLMNAAELLTQGAVEHAGRLGLATETQQARERARILEVAQTLLQGGMTLRQAAESLQVPTFTLRTWLHAAGIRVGAAATGTHPAPPRQPAAQPSSPPAPTGGQQPPGRSPVSRVNELAQQHLISGLRWEIHTDGPPHHPTFTCTVTATPTGKTTNPITAAVVTGTGTGTSKATAKANAAHALLTHLQPTSHG